MSEPVRTLDRVCRFLGVAEGRVGTVPPYNPHGFVEDSARSRALARVVRAGAAAGAFTPRPLLERRRTR